VVFPVALTECHDINCNQRISTFFHMLANSLFITINHSTLSYSESLAQLLIGVEINDNKHNSRYCRLRISYNEILSLSTLLIETLPVLTITTIFTVTFFRSIFSCAHFIYRVFHPLLTANHINPLHLILQYQN